MCVETIALISSVAGTVSSAVGAIQQGQASRRNANYQAQISMMNADISKKNAAFERMLGEEKSERQQMKARQAVGAMIASQGANGLDVNSGSNLDVRESATSAAKLDTETIKNDSARLAWGYESQAGQDVAQANLYRMEGRSSALAGFINAGSSLLSGSSQITNQYSRNYHEFGSDPLGLY